MAHHGGRDPAEAANALAYASSTIARRSMLPPAPHHPLGRRHRRGPGPPAPAVPAAMRPPLLQPYSMSRTAAVAAHHEQVRAPAHQPRGRGLFVGDGRFTTPRTPASTISHSNGARSCLHLEALFCSANDQPSGDRTNNSSTCRRLTSGGWKSQRVSVYKRTAGREDATHVVSEHNTNASPTATSRGHESGRVRRGRARIGERTAGRRKHRRHGYLGGYEGGDCAPSPTATSRLARSVEGASAVSALGRIPAASTREADRSRGRGRG